jgi:hypothetical protein
MWICEHSLEILTKFNTRLNRFMHTTKGHEKTKNDLGLLVVMGGGSKTMTEEHYI